jgi:hypothetical protein
MFLAHLIMAILLKFLLSWETEITYAPSNILLLETQPRQCIKIYWLLCTVNDLLIHNTNYYEINIFAHHGVNLEKQPKLNCIFKT